MSSKHPRVEIIAEIGLNHNGSKSLCKQLIESAKESGSDYIKFQMRSKDLYREYDYNNEDLGTQYVLNIINKCSLSDDIMFEMFDYSKEIGIEPICTPFDIESAIKLEEYGINIRKKYGAKQSNVLKKKKLKK